MRIILSGADSSLTQTAAIGPLNGLVTVATFMAIFKGAPNGTVSLVGSLDGLEYGNMSSQLVTGEGNILFSVTNISVKNLGIVWLPEAGSSGTIEVQCMARVDQWQQATI